MILILQFELLYQAKEADYLLQNKAMYEDKDHLSQVIIECA